MTPNSPLTYEDFISQVKEAMLPESPFRVTSEGNQLSFSGADKANSDFKFEDIEVGKIYAFWPSSNNHLWFLTPYDIQNEYDYSVYWCYYTKPTEGMAETNSGDEYKCGDWIGHIWSGNKWKVLGNNLFNPFINWNENPFEVKQ